jgi:penicillin V acylase-like amidase (Ntn superfamily)
MDNHNPLCAQEVLDPLDGSPAVTPRNYRWTSRTGTTGQTQYGFIGTGTDMEGFILRPRST